MATRKVFFRGPPSRREFIADLTTAAVAVGLPSTELAGCSKTKASRKSPICIFSKHLQWLEYEAMGQAAAELGFDGIALTVRPGGHVIPERAVDDLPKAVEAVKRAGIAVPMIVSSIIDPSDSLTEPVLKTAAQLGIGYYRLGYMHYDERVSIPKQLAELRPKMHDLAAMNKQFQIFGGNHNHSGNFVGASLWDEWELLKHADPNWIGFQHDNWHALNEGRGGSWRTNSRLVASRVKILSVKTRAEWGDSAWQESTDKDQEKWPSPTPDNLKWIFQLMRRHSFSGPISAHYEFPLGGPDVGARKLEGITKKELFAVFKRNLATLRTLLQETELL